MKDAITKSVEGGWKPKTYKNAKRFYIKVLKYETFLAKSELDRGRWVRNEVFWCDPLFWQNLCKSLSFGAECGFDKCPAVGEHKKCWMRVWHRFIDHLASGGNIDEFFKELLR